jgi:cell division protein FtsB
MSMLKINFKIQSQCQKSVSMITYKLIFTVLLLLIFCYCIVIDIVLINYLSVTQPVDALETDLAYLSNTPFDAFKAG